MLQVMRRWLHPSRSVAHLTCLAAAAVLLGACGSSANQSGPSTTSASSPTPSSASSPTPSPTSSPTQSTPTPSPAAGSPPCGPAAARTLAHDARVRVYVAGGQVFGCARGERTRYALGQVTTCLRGALVGPVKAAGVRVAYAVKRCGVDTGTSQVIVRRLDDGRTLAAASATATPLGAESYVTVSSLVLAGDGSAGWITEAGSIVSHRRLTEVHALDSRGTPRVLDSGPGIGPRSLVLVGGSQLRWRDAGRWRTARLA